MSSPLANCKVVKTKCPNIFIHAMCFHINAWYIMFIKLVYFCIIHSGAPIVWSRFNWLDICDWYLVSKSMPKISIIDLPDRLCDIFSFLQNSHITVLKAAWRRLRQSCSRIVPSHHVPVPVDRDVWPLFVIIRSEVAVWRPEPRVEAVIQRMVLGLVTQVPAGQVRVHACHILMIRLKWQSHFL